MHHSSKDIDALLTELGGPDEITELDVEHFAAELDDDTEAAQRALSRMAASGQYHRTAGLLLEVFMAAIAMGSLPLARAAREGVGALVHQARSEAAG